MCEVLALYRVARTAHGLDLPLALRMRPSYRVWLGLLEYHRIAEAIRD